MRSQELNFMGKSDFSGGASRCGGATLGRIVCRRRGGRTLAAALVSALAPLVLFGCVKREPLQAPAPAPGPLACAWFGDRRGDTLWFGISSFWAVSRERGAAAALGVPEPAFLGRFDLATESMQAPIPVGNPAGLARSGVWDVVGLEDGRIAYTQMGEYAGWLDPSRGESGRFPTTGTGVNEIVALPDGGVAITQYTNAEIVLIEGPVGGGAAPRRLPVVADSGTEVAPKSLAFDRSRGDAGWIWFNTDLFSAGTPSGHDARAIDRATGHETLRIESPELQNLVFAPDGTGYFVWAEGASLYLQRLPAGSPPARAGDLQRALLLSDDFRGGLDFAQDLVLTPTGDVLVTLWSGEIFVVDDRDRVRRAALARESPRSLYYSAALRGERICATQCGGVAVTCGDLPPLPESR